MKTSFVPPQYFQEHEWSTYDIRDGIGNITVPTLIVIGDDESPYIEIVLKILQKSISNSRLVIIENCGHWPFVEVPDVFFKKVIPFLSN